MFEMKSKNKPIINIWEVVNEHILPTLVMWLSIADLK